MTKRLLLAFLSLFFTASLASAWDTSVPEVQTWIADTHEKTGVPVAILTQWVQGAERQDKILETMDHPAEAWPWDRYQKALISEKRAKAGAAYWRDHQAVLDKFATQYDVDPAIIVSIIGIESYYGRYATKHDAFNALATLAFAYPRRAAYFQSELASLVDIAWKEKVTPHFFKGSYAGALGIPQFMPSNIKRFGVDGDGDHKIDLAHSHADAIASIANFLHHYGYHRSVEPDEHLLPNYKPTPDKTDAQADPSEPGQPSIITLYDANKVPYYYEVTPNYFAIKHYNPRDAYAMAIIKLAAAIRYYYVG